MKPYPLQAIETRYLPATNHKPRRIVAQSEGGARAVVSCPGHDSDWENHAAALRALLEKLNRATGDGWRGDYVAGGTRRGLCWVNVAPCAPRVLIPRAVAD